MKEKISKIVMIALVPFLLLILQGCMLMHFADDPHGGMMGHGQQHKDKGHYGETSGGKMPLDRELRKDTQGAVTIEIRFIEITRREDLAFKVAMSNHVIGISQYPLENQTTLANDQGAQVRASRWQSMTMSPQRISGTLYFPDRDDYGNLLLAPGTKNVTLRMGLAEGPDRIFQWPVASGHSGH
jgi:hypothetical protein